jgi:DNA-binding response OmpR family regulator
MVRDASYRITDADIARLLAEHSEDEVFEVTVAAAVGAALSRSRRARPCAEDEQATRNSGWLL